MPPSKADRLRKVRELVEEAGVEDVVVFSQQDAYEEYQRLFDDLLADQHQSAESLEDRGGGAYPPVGG